MGNKLNKERSQSNNNNHGTTAEDALPKTLRALVMGDPRVGVCVFTIFVHTHVYVAQI
jgi:hypothetical protein